MKPIDKAAALEMLGEDLDLIHNCVRLGWDDFDEEYTAEQKMKLSPRTRANTINDLIVFRARSAFDGHLRANCLDINQMFIVAFNSGIAVRFKKLSEGFTASNIPTQQALAFAQQGVLPGISESVNLNAGYRLDAFATKLEGVYLAYPRGRKANFWCHEFGADSGQGDGNNLLLPFTPGPGPLDQPAEKPYKIVRRGGEENDAASES